MEFLVSSAAMWGLVGHKVDIQLEPGQILVVIRENLETLIRELYRTSVLMGFVSS